MRACFELATACGVEEVLTVDPFGDRTSHTIGDPHILVVGRLDGSARRARAGAEGLAHVPLSDWLEGHRFTHDPDSW